MGRNQLYIEKEIESLADIESIYRAYYKTLVNIVFRIIKDPDASEDVVQEMFIKIWKKKDELKIESSLKAYLFRAASNAAINYLQAEKRNRVKEELSERIVTEKTVDESYKFNESEMESVINKALDKLPPKCKSIFLLSRFEGLKYKEIANRLCISIKTVENQMGIALKKLKEELHPYFNNNNKIQS